MSIIIDGAVEAVADKILDTVLDETLDNSGSADAPYEAKYNWRDGDIRLAIPLDDSKGKILFSALFEDGEVCIAGYGATDLLSEEETYANWQRYLGCTDHTFERGDSINGCGTCTKCGCMKRDVFEPLTRCTICDAPTYYARDNQDGFWCEKHAYDMPTALWTDEHWSMVYFEYSLRNLRAMMSERMGVPMEQLNRVADLVNDSLEEEEPLPIEMMWAQKL